MKIILIFSLFSFRVFACQITGADVVFTTDGKSTSPFTFKECNQSQVNSFGDLFNNSEGILKSKNLKSFPELASVSLSPLKIRIRSLNKMLHTRLGLAQNMIIQVVDKTIPHNYTNLKSDEFIQATCSTCSKLGIQNIYLTKSNGTKKVSKWIKAKISTEIEAVVAKDYTPISFKQLDLNKFKIKKVYVTNPNDYISRLEELNFHRSNQSFNANEMIRKRHLSPLQLVKYGTPSKVHLKSKDLTMSIQAMPMGPGKLGETIQLKNNKTKKIIVGKVIGKNEVVVEL